MTSKFRYYLGWAIKLGIVILTAGFIYTKLTDNTNLSNFLRIINGLDTLSVELVIGAVVALMMLNWLTESYKWQIMIHDLEPISFWTSLHSVVCALTVGIITPNRVGEYGVRVFFLSPRKRIYGLVVMGVGAYAQFVLTNMVAAIAVPTFLYLYKPVGNFWMFVIIAGSIVYCVFLLILYFRISLINRFLQKIRFLSRYHHFFNIVSTYKKSLLINVLALCLLRLVILVTQYYLLINLLIPAITYPQVALMIVMLFSIQTVVPSIDALDLGVRGTTAVYLFSFITHQDIAIIATTGAIWFINLILPSVAGLFMIVKLPQNKSANWLKF